MQIISRSKYMIMVKSVTNEITKKKLIKLISHYHYGVVVYNFTNPKKWNILKVCEKIHYMCVCVDKGKKRYI